MSNLQLHRTDTEQLISGTVQPQRFTQYLSRVLGDLAFSRVFPPHRRAITVTKSYIHVKKTLH